MGESENIREMMNTLDEVAIPSDWEVRNAWAEVEKYARHLRGHIRNFDNRVVENMSTFDDDQQATWAAASGIAEQIIKTLDEEGL